MKNIKAKNIIDCDKTNNTSSTEVNITYFMNEIDNYVEQYKHFAVKTAQSTVEMCRIVFEAKQNLDKDKFAKFCASVSQKPEDATIRKYIAIGSKYQQLIAHADLLPNSWTSIYLITQLPEDMFNALAVTSSDMSKFTGKQIQNLINSSKRFDDKEKLEEKIEKNSITSHVFTDFTPKNNSEIDNDNLECPEESPHAEDNFASKSPEELTPSRTEYIDQCTSTQKFTDEKNSCFPELDSKEFEILETPPYDVTMRFNVRPCDEACRELADFLNTAFQKYKFTYEILVNFVEHEKKF